MRARIVAAFALTGSSVALLICSACSTPVSTAVPAPSANTAAVASASSAALPTELKGVEYTENDFVESDRNRDPFRSYLVQSQPVNKTGAQPAEDRALAVLARRAEARRDRHGRRPAAGDVRRPERQGDRRLQGFLRRAGRRSCTSGGATDRSISSTGASIAFATGDVVLIREDPAQPAIPPATRVIPLHPEAEKQAAAEGLLPG